jgi:hypothetical protein
MRSIGRGVSVVGDPYEEHWEVETVWSAALYVQRSSGDSKTSLRGERDEKPDGLSESLDDGAKATTCGLNLVFGELQVTEHLENFSISVACSPKMACGAQATLRQRLADDSTQIHK